MARGELLPSTSALPVPSHVRLEGPPDRRTRLRVPRPGGVNRRDPHRPGWQRPVGLARWSSARHGRHRQPARAVPPTRGKVPRRAPPLGRQAHGQAVTVASQVPLRVNPTNPLRGIAASLFARALAKALDDARAMGLADPVGGMASTSQAAQPWFPTASFPVSVRRIRSSRPPSLFVNSINPASASWKESLSPPLTVPRAVGEP